MKKIVGFIILAVSLVFFVMGLIAPFMTFKIDIQMDGGGFFGNLLGDSIADKLNKTVSYNIPQAMKMLFEHNMYFVGFLVGFFAIVIPVTKTILTMVYLFNKRKKVYNIISFIGKFAMADVFCVGVMIAFLYTSFNKVLTARIEMGFYYFASYVILNIIALILLKSSRIKT